MNSSSRSRAILGFPGGCAARGPDHGGRCNDLKFLNDFAAPAASRPTTHLEGRVEDGLHVAQLPESLFQFRKPLFNKRLDFPAGGGPTIPEVEQRRNILEREADGLRGADEAETLKRTKTVDPVVPIGPPVRPQKPAALVVTDRRGRHTSLPSQPADGVARFHDLYPSKPCTLLQPSARHVVDCPVRTFDHLDPQPIQGSNQAEFERWATCACTCTPGSNQPRVRTFRSRGEPELILLETAGRWLTGARLLSPARGSGSPATGAGRCCRGASFRCPGKPSRHRSELICHRSGSLGSSRHI